MVEVRAWGQWRKSETGGPSVSGTSCASNDRELILHAFGLLPFLPHTPPHAPPVPPVFVCRSAAQYYGLTVISLGHMMHTMFRDGVLPPAGLQPCDFFAQVRPQPRCCCCNEKAAESAVSWEGAAESAVLCEEETENAVLVQGWCGNDVGWGQQSMQWARGATGRVRAWCGA